MGTVTRSLTDYREALRYVEKAKEIGRARDTDVSVAVCDAAGHPVAIVRGKEDAWHGPYMAAGKARLAAAFRKPTGALVRLWADRPLYANSLNDIIPGGVTLNPGGHPIFEDGQCIGAIGIGGNKPSIDEEIAAATVEALNAEGQRTDPKWPS